MTTVCRGVRGATTVAANEASEILKETQRLLALMIRLNRIDAVDVASAIFSTTRDLDAEFPALAARQLGWSEVPLLCCNEIPVQGSLERCVRILIHWNTDRSPHQIVHPYVQGARSLRPDLQVLPEVDWDELDAWVLEAGQPTPTE
ncbi:MAG: chorismate mutase [Myxococcales bacterium]|nr:chorismate mutase [Myxococcales bacterium]